MSGLIRIIITMSLSGGIVTVLLFTLKPLVKNRLPKSAQYCLWLVVIAALLVPVPAFIKLSADDAKTPFISVPSSLVDRYVITAEEELTRLSQGMPVYSEDNRVRHTQTAKQIKSPVSAFVTVFMLAYPIGAMTVLLYFIINYAAFTKLYRRGNTEAKAEEIAMLTALCENRRVPQIYRNPLAATPMLIGLLRPVVILPGREYTDARLRAILMHELTHLRRKDVLVKWLSVFSCAVHWFNPAVWLARREIDRACELSCDEAVIRNLDTDGKQNYGDTLLDMAANSKTSRAVLSTTMCEEKKNSKKGWELL